MKLKSIIFKQFGKPSGNLGKFAGWLMARKNTDRTNWTVEKLKLKSSDRLLEIGYGPGATIQKVAELVTNGFVTGIDHSETMLVQATKRNKNHIDANKVKLECGTVGDLNYPQRYFDTIYGSNVHFFWKNPVDEFKKLVLFLKPEGRLVMVFQPRWTKTEEEVRQVADLTRKQFQEAGLESIEIEFKKMKPVTCIYIGGEKQQ